MGTKDFKSGDRAVPMDHDRVEESASDAHARAAVRGIEYAIQDLLDAGGAYDLKDLPSILRTKSLEEIDRAVEEGAILSVPGSNNERLFPKVQFNPDGTIVAGLRAVAEAFPSRSPWALLNFLVNPQTQLGGARPIDRLRAGVLTEVISVAAGIGHQGY